MKLSNYTIDEDKIITGQRNNTNTLSFDNPRTTIVKRGKVNLSQHEKINHSISNEPLGQNSISKDLHNISSSFEKGQGSLNNTLSLQKQSSSGKKNNTRILGSGVVGGGFGTNNFSNT